jgi:hypothetical protein
VHTRPGLTAREIIDLSKKHTLFEWSAHEPLPPRPVFN